MSRIDRSATQWAITAGPRVVAQRRAHRQYRRRSGQAAVPPTRETVGRQADRGHHRAHRRRHRLHARLGAGHGWGIAFPPCRLQQRGRHRNRSVDADATPLAGAVNRRNRGSGRGGRRTARCAPSAAGSPGRSGRATGVSDPIAGESNRTRDSTRCGCRASRRGPAFTPVRPARCWLRRRRRSPRSRSRRTGRRGSGPCGGRSSRGATLRGLTTRTMPRQRH
jgi:hypothetical protein